MLNIIMMEVEKAEEMIRSMKVVFYAFRTRMVAQTNKALSPRDLDNNNNNNNINLHKEFLEYVQQAAMLQILVDPLRRHLLTHREVVYHRHHLQLEMVLQTTLMAI